MGRFNLIISLIFLSLAASYANGDELTLEKFLIQVKQANPLIRAATNRQAAAKSRVDPASTWDDPFFAGGLDDIPLHEEDEEMGSVQRFQLTQTVPFPGKMRARAMVAESKADSSQFETETTVRELMIRATQAYFQYYYNQRAIYLNENLTELMKSTFKSTASRYKTGDAGHHDLLLSKIEVELIQIEQLRLLRAEETLRASLNELRDQPSETLIALIHVPFPKNDRKEPSPDLRSQPELSAMSSYIGQVEGERRLAQLAYYPDFLLQGMLMRPNSSMSEEKPTWGFMVGVNLPLYYWRKQNDLSRAADLEREAAHLERRNLENRLNTEITDARQQLKTAMNITELYETSVLPATKLAVDSARSGYASRNLPLKQLIDVLKVQKAQQLELLASQIDVQLARTRLEYLLSSPPIKRFAPIRPSLFNGTGMSNAMEMGTEAVGMGSGMTAPKTNEKRSPGTANSGAGGMGGM